MKRFNKFLIKYSLVIITVLMLIILWGVFYLLSGPMIYQGEAILGSLANASDTPPAFLAFSIIIDIVISIYVIYQANKSKVLCKSN